MYFFTGIFFLRGVLIISLDPGLEMKGERKFCDLKVVVCVTEVKVAGLVSLNPVWKCCVRFLR